jgi:hypothetical protein
MKPNDPSVAKAKEAAEKFLAAIMSMEDRYQSDDHFREFCGICGFRETANVRRLSMDLTHALAALRKGA